MQGPSVRRYDSASGAAVPYIGAILDQHSMTADPAARWKLWNEFIRDLFRVEPDILTINRPETIHKRRYSTFRIPESVAQHAGARLKLR